MDDVLSEIKTLYNFVLHKALSHVLERNVTGKIFSCIRPWVTPHVLNIERKFKFNDREQLSTFFFIGGQLLLEYL